MIHPWDVTLTQAEVDGSALNQIGGSVGSIAVVANRVRVTAGPVVAEVTAESAARLGIVPGVRMFAS